MYKLSELLYSDCDFNSPSFYNLKTFFSEYEILFLKRVAFSIFEDIPPNIIYNDFLIELFNDVKSFKLNNVNLEFEKIKKPNSINFLYLLLDSKIITEQIFVRVIPEQIKERSNVSMWQLHNEHNTYKVTQLDRLNYILSLNVKSKCNSYFFEENNTFLTQVNKEEVLENIYMFQNAYTPTIKLIEINTSKEYKINISELFEACDFDAYGLLNASGFKITLLEDITEPLLVNDSEIKIKKTIIRKIKLINNQSLKIYREFKLRSPGLKIKEPDLIDVLSGFPNEINYFKETDIRSLITNNRFKYSEDSFLNQFFLLNTINPMIKKLLLYISNTTICYKDLVNYILDINLNFYQYINNTLKAEFVFRIFNDRLMLDFMPKDLYTDKNIMLHIIKYNPDMFNFLPLDLKKDDKYILELKKINVQVVPEINKFKKEEEFNSILNFKGYYSAGKIDKGNHGPEIDNEKLYISIYHYLQYIGEDPHDYYTDKLGNYLTTKSSDYKECKYETQSYDINKFNIDLLKSERNNFDKYKKAKNIISSPAATNKTNSYSGNFKPCPECGEMHNASFNRCAVCNGFSAYNDPDY